MITSQIEKNGLEKFKRLGVDVLENETRIMNIDGVEVCIRGLGDYRSHRFRFCGLSG